jgi:hypothetical protein
VPSEETQGPLLTGTTKYNPIKVPFTLFIRSKDALCKVRLVQERIDRNAPDYLIREAFTQLSRYCREEGLEKRLEANAMANDAELLEKYIKQAEKCILQVVSQDFKVQINSIEQNLSSVTGTLKDQVEET